MSSAKWKRRYKTGQCCQDCGHLRRTTVVEFWASGLLYRVCGECVKAYRKVITTGKNYETIYDKAVR